MTDTRGNDQEQPLELILARNLISLLIHDAQYSEGEYPAHRGWGHSSLSAALAFARRCDVQRLLLFHHDPSHDDAFLEALRRGALDRWTQLDGQGSVDLAREGVVLDLATAALT